MRDHKVEGRPNDEVVLSSVKAGKERVYHQVLPIWVVEILQSLHDGLSRLHIFRRDLGPLTPLLFQLAFELFSVGSDQLKHHEFGLGPLRHIARAVTEVAGFDKHFTPRDYHVVL